jgi:hypothetical protein
MNFSQRNYVFTLETLSSSDTLFVRLFQASLIEMLDEWYEDIFRIVLFEGDVRVREVRFDCVFIFGRMPWGLLASVMVKILFYLFSIRMHMLVT